MSDFWYGFYKTAAKDQYDETGKKISPLKAGLATTGALAAGHTIKEEYRDMKENASVRKTRSIKDLKKKLKPGDIIFTRFDSKHSPVWEADVPKFLQKLIKKKKVNMPIKASELVQMMAGGSTHYHGALHVGKGKVLEAQGQDMKSAVHNLKNTVSGNDVKVYRITDMKKRDIDAAAEWGKKQKGVRYANNKELVRHGAGHLFGANGPKSCRPRGKKGPLVCTTVITKAHPKKFKREFMSPDEMRAQKGMKLVARFGKSPPTRLRTKILQRGIYPVLKNSKWGVAAAGAAYAANKLRGTPKEQPAFKKERGV